MFYNSGDTKVYMPKSDYDPIRYYNKELSSNQLFVLPEAGYYFWDEIWRDLYGPFNTIEQCKKELMLYQENL